MEGAQDVSKEDDMKGKLQPGKCKRCGFTYGEHAIATPKEVKLLRSLGYAAFICSDVEDNPFLTGDYVWIVAVSSEGETLEISKVEEMFKDRESDNPCDSGFMEDIST